jgi:hypothetical protein
MSQFHKIAKISLVTLFSILFVVSIFFFSPLTQNKLDTQLVSDDPVTASTLPLISDDFETYANKAQLGVVWSIYEGTGCTVDISTDQSSSPLQSVKFVDNSLGGTDQSTLSRSVGYHEYLYVNFKVYPLQTDEAFSCHIYNNSGHILAVVGLAHTGYFFYGSDNLWHGNTPYTSSAWYTFEILADVLSRTFTIYIDGVLMAENVISHHDDVWHAINVGFQTSTTAGAGSAT